MSLIIDPYRFTPPAVSIVEYVGSELAVAGLTIPVDMPAVVNSGDMLEVYVCVVGSNGSMSASGWTQILTQVGGASIVTCRLFRKLAAGTEGGTTVNFTMSSSRVAAAVCARIPAAYVDSATNPAGAAATSATNTPDPPNLTPGWTANNIWLQWVGTLANPTVTAYPYPSGQFQHFSGSGSSHSLISVCYTQSNVASLNPPSFTLSAPDTWVAVNNAVKPP